MKVFFDPIYLRNRDFWDLTFIGSFFWLNFLHLEVMKPFLVGCNQENGNKMVCLKLIKSVFSKCVLALEVFGNTKFQLDQELLG